MKIEEFCKKPGKAKKQEELIKAAIEGIEYKRNALNYAVSGWVEAKILDVCFDTCTVFANVTLGDDAEGRKETVYNRGYCFPMIEDYYAPASSKP